MATQVTTYGREERDLYEAPDFDSFYRSPGARSLADRFEALLDRVDLCSFDVFDTLLLRDERSELERFRDIAAEFIRRAGAEGPESPLVLRSCLSARILAASAAYQLSPAVKGCREGRLSEIIANAVDTLGLPQAPFARIWHEAEMEVETSQLRASAFIEELLDLALARGKRVVLVSDMYMPAGDISRLLEASGISTGKIERIFSSADTVVNKRSGLVYDLIAEETGVAPARMLHMGDALEGDFLAAKRRGLQAIHLPIPRALLRRRLDSHRAVLDHLSGESGLPLPIAPPAL
ncbi:HAD family hydrolase [Mangrovicoccus algicola]|uniref:HAD family hydrolase n=1 Tax=Mangrovicoccus algicola TaxID=2771008 RepID=A0A8J6YZI6_9RHOB|nr:HAD family hydrolase [Mangrovicoccus algicola]MBE3640540.1 hypothetical protein [Mangrovicoccus algicola]